MNILKLIAIVTMELRNLTANALLNMTEATGPALLTVAREMKIVIADSQAILLTLNVPNIIQVHHATYQSSTQCKDTQGAN